jgi:glutamate-1-semialdehyde 2,1-aminomutase
MTSTVRERAVRVMPGGVSSGQRSVPGIEDLVVVTASGATFVDQTGREYVDFHAAFGPTILGHADPDVDASVIETIRRIDLIGVGVTATEVALCERLSQLMPSMEQVLLTSTGSEATFHALRLARAVTGRRYVAKFQGCYHGWHDSVSMNVISDASKVGGKDLLSEGMLPEVVEATRVCRFNDLEDVERALRDREVAALIIEPIPHNIGAVLPQPGFLEGLRNLCDRYGTILVFDEVITGIRHGMAGYQGISGVRPDLTALGKAIANGYPIGALGGRADLMQEFSSRPGGPVFFAGTYNGHPAPVAAALATLDKLEREPVHEHIFGLGNKARAGLRDVFDDIGIPAVVTGFGSVFVTYFMDGEIASYEDLLRNDTDMYVSYRLAQLDSGVFELPLNLKRSHFSYAHTDNHVDQLLQATSTAVRTVLARRKTTGSAPARQPSIAR